MATADVPRSKRKSAVKPPQRRSRFGWRLFLVLFVVGLFSLVAAAPTIVANTPLRNWLLASALQTDGSVTLGSASLGWFSNIWAEDIVLGDPQGEEILHIEALESDKPLVAMLLDLADLGRIRLERPTLHLVVDERSSNLEEALAGFLQSRSRSRVTAEVEVVDGAIVVDDISARRQFRIDNLDLHFATGSGAADTQFSMQGKMAEERTPASFKVVLQIAGTADGDEPVASGKVDIETSDLPLELLEPLLRRQLVQAQIGGLLTTNLRGSWGKMSDGGDAAIDGAAQATNLLVSAAALGRDPIRLKSLEMPCRITQRGDRFEIEKLELICALGQASLVGSVRQSDFAAGNRLAALLAENYELTGQLDLARLATMLPDTLAIREGTEITSGQVNLSVSSRRQPGGMTWSGRLDATHLAGEANGRPLVWDNPLACRFQIVDDRDGLAVERIECESDFLQLTASGTLEKLTANANFDLARLTAKLKQFSDLKGAQLAGQGALTLVWEQRGEDRFAADADFQARGFRCLLPQAKPWIEEQLQAKLRLSGRLQERSITSIATAQLEIDSPDEQLRAELTDSLADPWRSVWPVKCAWRGRLDQWAPRLAGVAGLTGWDFDGTGTVDANLKASGTLIEIEHAAADFAQLRATGKGWFINENKVSLEAAGKLDLSKGQLDLVRGQVTAGNSGVAISRAAVVRSQGEWQLEDGVAKLDVDVAQIYRSRHDPRVRPPLTVAGRLTADARLQEDRGIVTGQFDGSIDGLQVVDLARPVAPGRPPASWDEPKLTFSGRGTYDLPRDRVQIAKLQLAGQALRGDTTGTVNLENSGRSIELAGTIQYDWEELAPLWQAYIGRNVWIAGKQSQKFSVQGPIDGEWDDLQSWRRVQADAAVGWARMDVHGLQIGAGEIDAQLAEGQLRTRPIDFEVGEGRMTVTPLVRLTPAPAELLLSRGPLLTNIHMTPEMCAQALKFVAPVLSESTVAEGVFSVQLDGGRVPLDNIEAGDISGRMAIRAQVKPGPVAHEFVFLIKELSALLKDGNFLDLDDRSGALISVDGSNVEFRLTGGRVYHRNLQITVGNMQMRTYGSVGMDESLALVVEVPMEAKLLGVDLSFGALEGQTLKIPIEGTLDKPKLDRHVVQNLTGQMIQNTARGALLDGVEKGLERLLPGR